MTKKKMNVNFLSVPSLYIFFTLWVRELFEWAGTLIFITKKGPIDPRMTHLAKKK